MTFNFFSIFFLSAIFLFLMIARYLDIRQIRAIRCHFDLVPQNFREKISLAQHQKAGRYTKEKLNFTYIETLFSVFVIIAWTLLGGFNLLNDFWQNTLNLSPLWLGVCFLISFLILNMLIGLPFAWYASFVIERRFGFNYMTLKTFILDTSKEIVLVLMLGVPIVLFTLYLMNITGDIWWLFVWIMLVVISIIMLWLYPSYIAPLFNKFIPLEDKNLTLAIEELLSKTGFKSQGIFVMDGSRRSSHGNAYFTGIGKNKRIVFFDTLLKNMSHQEIIAILAHELGHFHHKHIYKKMLRSFTFLLFALAVLGYLMQKNWFYDALNIHAMIYHTALASFILIAPIFTFFTKPIFNLISRKYEFEADRFASEQINPRDLITALVSLYRDNASTLTPDKYYSIFYDSHPNAFLRINYLKTQMS